VLEHPLVEHELGSKQLEALDLGLKFPDAPGIIGLGRVMTLSPAVKGVLPDAELAAHVADGEPLGHVAACFPQQALDLLASPSLAHKSLLGLACARTTISPGPDFGEQTNPSRHRSHDAAQVPDSERCRRLIARMNAVSESESFGVAIVTVEERMRGWPRWPPP